MATVQRTDQMQRTVQVPAHPVRIVSLVPSQTELLFHLGLHERVVGVTRFCVHPAEALRTKPSVGGTKKFDFEQIHALRPDLILGNKEENYREGIEALSRHYPVWMSDIEDLPQALAMIRFVGELANTTVAANQLVNQIEDAWRPAPFFAGQRALYLIWRKPWMAAARHTFIDALMTTAGLQNAAADRTRYPALTAQDIERYQPEVVLLSSEPFPFRDRHVAEVQALLPGARVLLVDGEMFSWYGSRLLYTPGYFRQLAL
jgi:ABC-type Fe3+-hydroxamate transport system substrate-binding protein